MPQSLKISPVLQQNHAGKVVISLHGKVVAIGKNSLVAFKKAKKILPNIENEEFVVSRIHHKYLVA